MSHLFGPTQTEEAPHNLGLVTAPDFFQHPRGTDQPRSFHGVNEWARNPCVIVLSTLSTGEDGQQVPIYRRFGSFEGNSSVQLSYDISSQMPLVNVVLRNGKTGLTVLAYDNDSYIYDYVVESNQVASFGELDPELLSQIQAKPKLVVWLRPKRDYDSNGDPTHPVVKGHHPSRLRSEGNSEAWDAFQLLIAGGDVAILRDHFESSRRLCEYYHKLIEMRSVSIAGTGAVKATDYWHYAAQPLYQDVAGHRQTRYHDEGTAPAFPYWMATRVGGIVDPDTRKVFGNQAIEVVDLPAKLSFHNTKEYEILWGAALLWSGIYATKTLRTALNGKVVHGGRVVPARMNQSTHGWVHVDLTLQDEFDRVRPEAPLTVKVKFWNREKNCPLNGNTLIAEVTDYITDSDFVMLMKLENKTEPQNYRYFTIEADIITVPEVRMMEAVSSVASLVPREDPESDTCGRLSVKDIILAHGPEVDRVHGTKVRILNLIPAEQKAECLERVRKIKDLFQLDASQALAFDMVMEGLTAGILLIQGPPGTGKTRVDAAIILALAACHIRCLVGAGSNAGTNALMLAIIDCIERPGNEWLRALVGLVVRYTTPPKTMETLLGETQNTLRTLATLAKDIESGQQEEESRLQNYTMAAWIERMASRNPGTNDTWKGLFDLIPKLKADKATARGIRGKDWMSYKEKLQWAEEQILGHRETYIVASTMSNTAAASLSKFDYDVCIGDEAGQTLEPDNMIAVQRQPRIMIFSGDHRQLPPTVPGLKSKKLPLGPQLALSYFDRLRQRDYPFVMLKTNYRMHPEISEGPNKQEYFGQVEDSPMVSLPNPFGIFWNEWVRQHPVLSPMGDRRLIFINVQGDSEKAADSTSWHNKAHAKVIRTLIAQLMSFRASKEGAKRSLEGRDLAVIAPYRDQKRLVSKDILELSGHVNLREDVKNTKVATVDGFQGHEREFVLLDFTGVKGQLGQVGFLSDPRRQNVGLTRAKNGLIVIGNLTSLTAALPLIQRYGNAPALANFIEKVVLERRCHVDWPIDTAGQGTGLPIRPPGPGANDGGPGNAGPGSAKTGSAVGGGVWLNPGAPPPAFAGMKPAPPPKQKRPASPVEGESSQKRAKGKAREDNAGEDDFMIGYNLDDSDAEEADKRLEEDTAAAKKQSLDTYMEERIDQLGQNLENLGQPSQSPRSRKVDQELAKILDAPSTAAPHATPQGLQVVVPPRTAASQSTSQATPQRQKMTASTVVGGSRSTQSHRGKDYRFLRDGQTFPGITEPAEVEKATMAKSQVSAALTERVDATIAELEVMKSSLFTKLPYKNCSSCLRIRGTSKRHSVWDRGTGYACVACRNAQKPCMIIYKDLGLQVTVLPLPLEDRDEGAGAGDLGYYVYSTSNTT